MIASAEDSAQEHELAELTHAFERGDYRAVRAGTARVERTFANAEIRRRVLALRARTDADPTAKWIFLISVLAITGIAGYWLVHRPGG